jgi:hypothetical protein
MNILRNYRKPIAVTMIGAMTAISAPIIPANAAIIGTDRIIEQTQGSARDRVNAFLAREDVRAQLEALGVSPDEARSRVAALSDREVSKIAGKLDMMPAGEGVLGALIGAALIVFLVLLITDILGFTHVFGFTKKGSARP